MTTQNLQAVLLATLIVITAYIVVTELWRELRYQWHKWRQAKQVRLEELEKQVDQLRLRLSWLAKEQAKLDAVFERKMQRLQLVKPQRKRK